jgi:hypothetical protein
VLKYYNRNKHILLTKAELGRDKALLVRLMECNEEPANIIYCGFIGSVYFNLVLGSSENDEKAQNIKVRISNSERMQEVGDNA